MIQQGRKWNILCWNVHGINAEDKHLAIRNAVSASGCDVFCLQETKRTVLIILMLNRYVLSVLINLHMFLLGVILVV